MEIRDDKVVNLIINSYYEAINTNIIMKHRKRQNRCRSEKFIELLTYKFVYEIQNANCIENTQVFSLSNGYSKSLKLNEFLFDIHVCKMGRVESVKNKVNIEYVIESLIQIESELNNKDSKEVVKDFSKLVCGSECLKIMIMSRYYHYNEKMLEILAKVAENIKGIVYLVVIEHPDRWSFSKGINNYFRVYHYEQDTKKFNWILENV